MNEEEEKEMFTLQEELLNQNEITRQKKDKKGQLKCKTERKLLTNMLDVLQ